MPCNADYMNPTQMEKEMSVVSCLIDELNGVEPKPTWWNGYHPDVYCKRLDKQFCDNLVSRLCSYLKSVGDITVYSLEMQIWWRDHQKADQKRLEEEYLNAKIEDDRRQLLERLTPYEKELLGIN